MALCCSSDRGDMGLRENPATVLALKTNWRDRGDMGLRENPATVLALKTNWRDRGDMGLRENPASPGYATPLPADRGDMGLRENPALSPLLISAEMLIMLKQEQASLAGQPGRNHEVFLCCRWKPLIADKTVVMPIPDTAKETMRGKHVRPSSAVCADENAACSWVAHRHRAAGHSVKRFVNDTAHANGIESVWAVLKRGYNVIYRNWPKKRCHRRVNEFAFRLSKGNRERDTQDRPDDWFRAMVGKTITRKELAA